MRVLIFTFGTRGDVEPYAALADRLTAHGHTAVLAAPEAYRESLAPGVEFRPMATEMDRVMRAGMARLRGPSEGVKLAGQMLAAMRISLVEQWEIAKDVGPTIIVAHPKALGGLHIGERLGVPCVASLPLPFLTPTTAFPIPFIGRPLPGPVNRTTYQFNRFTALAYGGMINTFRRDTLALPRMSRFSDYLTTRDGRAVHALYPFSPHVVPVPRDYPATSHITGYWFDENAAGWEPPIALSQFLEDGPAIYVGFGSMGFGGRASERGRAVARALADAAVRAVVSTGWGSLAIDPTPDVFPVNDVPHRWLFPRVEAVVHHGGSGTTAAGLRAGKPTLVCPILGDQPFWGRRMHDLGVGPRPLPLRSATPQSLSQRITELVSTDSFAANAATVASSIADEDGPANAIEVLEAIQLEAG